MNTNDMVVRMATRAGELVNQPARDLRGISKSPIADELNKGELVCDILQSEFWNEHPDRLTETGELVIAGLLDGNNYTVTIKKGRPK